MSLFGKKRDHGEVGTRNPEGLPEEFQGGLEDVGWLFFLDALLRDPHMVPSGPHLLYCLLLNHQYREKQITVCSFWLHRSEGETVRSRGSLFCSYSHWNYEVSIAVGPISAEGLTKERQNFLMCLILFFEIGSTHTAMEKVTAAALPSAAQICPLLCYQWGRPYQDLVP